MVCIQGEQQWQRRGGLILNNQSCRDHILHERSRSLNNSESFFLLFVFFKWASMFLPINLSGKK